MTITDLVNKIIIQVLRPAIILIFSLGLVVFLWGVFQYVIGAQGDQTKLKQGRQTIIWGIIGMVIMASAWGIVAMLCRFFETCSGAPVSPAPFTSPTTAPGPDLRFPQEFE